MMQPGGEARALLRALKRPTESMTKTAEFFCSGLETCREMVEKQGDIYRKFIDSRAKTSDVDQWKYYVVSAR
jgi:hypothetical protein